MRHFESRDKTISSKLVLVFGNVDEIFELSSALMQTLNPLFKQALDANTHDAPALAEAIIHWSVCHCAYVA